MERTYLILDGLQDPNHAAQLSRRWTDFGNRNVVDVSGQHAWLARKNDDQDGWRSLTEAEADRAASVARSFGLLVRDRAGNAYTATNSLDKLQAHIRHEYRSRLATALVFGLPALALHYAGPILAGGAIGPRSMVYPWLMQMLLTGWACIAAGWPILCQGTLSLAHLRATGDLLTTTLLLWAFIPSAWNTISLAALPGTPPPSTPDPSFHAVVYLLLIALTQRWLAHRHAPALSGRADRMLAGFGRVVSAWLIIAIATAATLGRAWGLAFGILMPPMMSLGAVHPSCVGWTAVLPVLAFAGLMMIGPGAFEIALDGAQIETAAAFGLMMTAVFWRGWRALPRLRHEPPAADGP